MCLTRLPIMNCEAARQQMGPNPGPRPYSDSADAAWDHIGSCEACQAFYAARNAAQDRLAHLLADLRRVSAPSHLRSRISSALEAEVAGIPVRGRRWPWAGLLAAAAAITLLAITQLPNGDALAAPLANAARTELEHTTMVGTANLAEAEAWLEREMGHRIAIPDIANAVLVGARISDIGGQRSAAAVYLSRGMPVTYFAMPTGEVMGRRVDPNSITAGTSGNYEVALWTEHGHTRAIAAPMTRVEIVEMANECRSKASTD